MTIKRICTIGILLFLAAIPQQAHARRRRDSDAGRSRSEVLQQSAKVNPTYLDTLNAGDELLLKEADFAPISPSSAVKLSCVGL